MEAWIVISLDLTCLTNRIGFSKCDFQTSLSGIQDNLQSSNNLFISIRKHSCLSQSVNFFSLVINYLKEKQHRREFGFCFILEDVMTHLLHHSIWRAFNLLNIRKM